MAQNGAWLFMGGVGVGYGWGGVRGGGGVGWGGGMAWDGEGGVHTVRFH